MSFNNKVVIVTGGSSGIGAATAIKFAREGANVVITGRNEANLNSVAEKCAQVGKKALTVKADISKDNEAATVVQKTIDKFGKIDVLVNNAGIFRICSALDKNAVAIYDEVNNTNMRPVVVLTNLAGPHLVKTKGNIVNVSSICATINLDKYTAYSTSKAALDHFTRGVARELAEFGVRVNIISPGPVQTPILETSGSGLSFEGLKTYTALNRISEVDEIADLIAYVASDKAGSITGSNYVIDCGVLLVK